MRSSGALVAATQPFPSQHGTAGTVPHLRGPSSSTGGAGIWEEPPGPVLLLSVPSLMPRCPPGLVYHSVLSISLGGHGDHRCPVVLGALSARGGASSGLVATPGETCLGEAGTGLLLTKVA